MVPPWIVMVIGDPLSSPAKRRKGNTDWKTRRILAADSAFILMFRLTRFAGGSFGLNSNDELPTLQPVTSAAVASARYCSEEMCCALRPAKTHQPKIHSRNCDAYLLLHVLLCVDISATDPPVKAGGCPWSTLPVAPYVMYFEWRACQRCQP